MTKKNNNIRLSKQTKTLFVQLLQKVLFEGVDIRETLNDLEFATDDENLLHCLNPPTVVVDWEMLEENNETGEDFFGVEEED